MESGNFYGEPHDTVGELTPTAGKYGKVEDMRSATEDEIAMYYLGMTNNK